MRFTSYCVVAMLVTSQTFSQSPTWSRSTSASDDFKLYLRLTGRTFTSPLRWDGTDWLKFGGVVAGTSGAVLLDDEAFNVMERNHSSFNNGLSDATVHYGSGITGIVAPVGLYVAGLAFENQWLRETSVLMASALTVSVATEFTIKLALGRARPYNGLGNGTFKPFNGNGDFLSFPSGHTIVAFTLSTVLSERINNTWASIGLYSLSTLVAASRMYTRDHWLSDVVFAGALSTFVARSVVHEFERSMTNDGNETGLRIIPQTNGVTVMWRF